MIMFKFLISSLLLGTNLCIIQADRIEVKEQVLGPDSIKRYAGCKKVLNFSFNETMILYKNNPILFLFQNVL